jgi:hypothetical protein
VTVALAFAVDVLGAEVVYADEDFAVLRACGSEWMVQADHAYGDHPLAGSLGVDVARGVGAELRLHGRDPDLAEAAARKRRDVVLAGAMDKPHGLRERHIVDPYGYVWAVDRPL